ncbi:MAG TPA: STAS domain-containing protein [Ilumatobacteraceae bacterium]
MLVPLVVPHLSRLSMRWRVAAHIDGHTIKATAVIHVDGDVDSGSAADLLATISSIMRPTCSSMVVELSDCSFVCVAGLHELDDFIAQTSEGTTRIRVYGLSRTARRVIDVAGLRHLAAATQDDDFIDVPSLDERSYLGELTVVWSDAHTVDVTLIGEFDIANDANVRAALEPIADGRPANLRLHTSDVTFAGSSTVGLLMWLHHRITSDGGSFEIADMSASVRRLLHVAGASSLLAFSAPRQQAAS